MSVYDDTVCQLGEGPMWHPGINQLFWFDILGNRLTPAKGIGCTIGSLPRMCRRLAGWMMARC